MRSLVPKSGFVARRYVICYNVLLCYVAEFLGSSLGPGRGLEVGGTPVPGLTNFLPWSGQMSTRVHHKKFNLKVQLANPEKKFVKDFF